MLLFPALWVPHLPAVLRLNLLSTWVQRAWGPCMWCAALMLSLLSVVRRLMKRECCDPVPVTVISGKHCSVLPFLPLEIPWAS